MSPRTPFLQFHYTLLFLLLQHVAGISQIPYSQYCNDVVSDIPLTQPLAALNVSLALHGANVRAPVASSGLFNPRTLNFYTQNAYQTQKGQIVKLEGGLRFSGRIVPENFGDFIHRRRRLRLVYHRPPRVSGGGGLSKEFRVSGFWDSGTGKLCMVGSGLRLLSSVDVVLKLDYLNSSDILHSVVNGTLERIDVNDKSAYTKPVQILGLSMRNYVYTLIDKEFEDRGFSEYGDWSNSSLGILGIDTDRNVCSVIRRAGTMEMMYLGNCSNGNCDFLGGGNESSFKPTLMWFNEIECGDNGRGRFLLNFGDGVRKQLSYFINRTLVAEGKWDEKTKTVNMIGCQILNGSDTAEKAGFVGDCGVRLSLRLPNRWTLKERSVVVGEIWKRSKDSTKSSNYGKVALHSLKNLVTRLDGLTYEYTVIDNVTRSCSKYKGKGGKYPAVHSSDIRFDMLVRNRKKVQIFSHAAPLSVGDKFYRGAFAQVNDNQSTVVNISYVMHFSAPPQFLYSDEHSPMTIEISAEGLYDPKTGHLCMAGCMYFSSRKQNLQRNSSLDCEILVNIQYPPLNAKVGTGIRGTIESTRKKPDPLYFEPLELISVSVYGAHARESMWRMDLEMTMVLISNTLVCFFVGLQLFYVKRNPSVLLVISVVMLIVITLAHMIPLVLNFEALFLVNREKRNVYFGSDGWVEVNEVLIRVMTLIAFLLEFWLLQLTWSARAGHENPKTSWISDKKVLYLSLPMYICGGLITYFVRLSRNPHQMKLQISPPFHYQQQQTLWGELKSYAGLILDAFLLPQVLFNLFCNSTEMALTPGFYIGTTLVRLMPHVYDLYRAHSNAWSIDYIYGNPKMDYYSTAWDIIICCGGLLLAVLIFLQQKFGGRCFIPRRYRDSSTYEKVPVVSTEPVTEE